MIIWWNAARYSGSPILSSRISVVLIFGQLGLSRCLLQVILTFFPFPELEPTLYGDPVNGSHQLDSLRDYRMFHHHIDVSKYTVHSDHHKIFVPCHCRD